MQPFSKADLSLLGGRTSLKDDPDQVLGSAFTRAAPRILPFQDSTTLLPPSKAVAESNRNNFLSGLPRKGGRTPKITDPFGESSTMDSFAQASHLGSGPSQLARDRKAELSLPQSWPTGRSLPASTTAPKSDNVLPRQLPVWQKREQQDSEDSLRQHTLRSPLNLQLVEKFNQDQPESMFMHYAISEDRCGDNETVRSQLLAALGARSSSGFVSKNIDEDKPNNVMSPGGKSDRAAPEPDKRALHISGLDPRVTEDVLRQIFETTGPVSNVKIVPDKNYQSKGFNYASVEFDDPGAAERAMNTLNGRRIHEQEIQVNWAYQSIGSQKGDDQAMLNQVKKSWKDIRTDLRRSEEHTANVEVPEHVFESSAPMYVEQVFERARRHYRNQSYRRCIADCTRIIEQGLKGLDESRLIAQAWDLCGDANLEMDHHKKAIQCYENSLREHRTSETLSKFRELRGLD